MAGTKTSPHLELDFGRGAVLPQGHPRAGELVVDWVRRAPGREWDRTRGIWLLTATGAARPPSQVLARAGFDIEYPDDVFTHVDDLWPPIARLSRGRPGVALIRHRFAGFDRVRTLLPSATWDKTTQRFEVAVTDLLDDHHDVIDGLVIDDDTHSAAVAAALRTIGPDDADTASAAAAAALSTGIGSGEVDVSRLVAEVGDVPDWFGLNLRPYQRLAALAALCGRNFIADDPGAGKTRAALAAAAIKGARRVLVVSPPVAVTHWGVEAAQSGITVESSSDPDPTTTPEHVACVRAGRKEPELPPVGVAVVPDSLLSSRPALLNRLIDWRPDVVIVDESHRYRTWISARSKAIRSLCLSMPPETLCLPMTGTPMFTSPAELAAQLAISGHLGPVFGGYEAFVEQTCRTDKFGNLRPQKRKLGWLRRELDSKVWVRRKKADILPDLPGKSRTSNWLDVDLAAYRASHADALETVTEWVEDVVAEHGSYPTSRQVDAYVNGRIALVSPLRKAAGLAKVPAAVEMIENWVASNVTDGTVVEPLVVWAHHREAVAELAAAAIAKVGDGMVDVIDGASSSTERGKAVQAFQGGLTAVLICSITAAGVGVTLTRGSTQLFVETSWDVPEVTQAEDRQDRFGQQNHVQCQYLLATGTLDGRIFTVLQEKSEVLTQAVTGSQTIIVDGLDADVSTTAAEVVRSVVDEAIDRHQAKGRRRAA
ncbi:helicase-related protein [Aeromicrobium sp. CTD01-1L150]|uniref:helicase-related protein n=1 Tax=Aeromicrobium sp. CTD01-1L150 TaxID=3341830 RepID=UPI0035C1103C